MEAHESKQLALHKAITSHEQAAAGLADLMGVDAAEVYEEMLARLTQNIEGLHRELARSVPGDHV
jgi:hypothetical protein